MKIDIEVDGVDELFKKLQQLPVEMASKNGGPIRFGLRKASKLHIMAPLKARIAARAKDSGQMLEGVKVKMVEARKRNTGIRNASNFEGFYTGIQNGYVKDNNTGEQVPIGPRAYVSEFGGKAPDTFDGASAGYRPAQKWFRSGLKNDFKQAENFFRLYMGQAMIRIVNKVSRMK